MSNVELEINGRTVTAPQGSMLIEAAESAGVYIPRFCYHKKLSVVANCRMCLVQIKSSPRKPVPACATPVSPGMKVYTQSEMTIAAQKAVMEFLLINHPLDCPICDQGGECELQDLAMGYGKGVSRFTEGKRAVKDKDLGPLVATDMTRCIHCTRCVRFGQEVAGLPELGATGRGEHMEIGTYVEKAMQSELSGNIIDLCPVGALTSKPYRFTGRAWEMRQHSSIAPHDCVGSNIYVHTRFQSYTDARSVMRVVPKDNEDINETWISDRDRFSYEGLSSPDRLTEPMVKRHGKWEAVSWVDAMAVVSSQLKVIAEEAGPEAIGALAGPSATLESQYLLQKVVRSLGSSNIDHRLREIDCSDQDAAPLYPGLAMPLNMLEQCTHIVLIGSNIRQDQPLACHRVRKAALAGAKVVTINIDDYAMNFDVAAHWNTGVSGLPGGLANVGKALLAASKADLSQEAQALLSAAEDSAEASAIAAQLQLDVNAKVAVILGPDAFNHPNASAVRALSGLIADQLGAQCSYLTTGANAAGAWLAGAIPHRLPGGKSVAKVGLDANAMLSRPLKAYLLQEFEAEHDTANAEKSLAALKGADFVVALTAFDSEALREYADVILPVVPFTETDGTFVNAQGDWQHFNAVSVPFEQARPAWKVLRVLGNALGLSDFEFESAEQVCEALRAELGGAGDQQPSDGWAWKAPDLSLNQGMEMRTWHMYDEDALVRRASALQRTKLL